MLAMKVQGERICNSKYSLSVVTLPSRFLYSRERVSNSHRIGCCVGPSADLDNSKYRKIPCSARNLSRILSCQAHNICPKQTTVSWLISRPKQPVLVRSYSTDGGNRELPILLYMDIALNHIAILKHC